MNKLYILGIIVFLSSLQGAMFGQSGFVSMYQGTSYNCTATTGQVYASNSVSAGYTNEGLQQSFLADAEDTLLIYASQLPYTYREAVRNPQGIDYVLNAAGTYPDIYLLSPFGIDTLMDVALYSVECPPDMEITAPYSVCAIPVDLELPVIKPDGSVPPVTVTCDSIALYPCDDTTVVHWQFAVSDKSLTCDQDIIVHFPPCGIADGFMATDVEGNNYNTVRINCYCWTKENLKSTRYGDGTAIPFANIHTSDLYPDADANLAAYGRLYSWYSAAKVPEGNNASLPTADANGYVQGSCPDGWRIPSQAEMSMLTAFTANELKADHTWLIPGNDASGFTALPAGLYANTNHRYENVPGATYFWTADCGTYTAANGQLLYYCDAFKIENLTKADALSVRCLKN